MDDEEYFLSLIPKPLPDRYRPKTLSDPIRRVLAKYGISEEQAAQQREQAWIEAVGSTLAKDTRLGHLKRGVQLVLVRNNLVMQEIHLRKRSILSTLRSRGMNDVRELQLRVDSF